MEQPTKSLLMKDLKRYSFKDLRACVDYACLHPVVCEQSCITCGLVVAQQTFVQGIDHLYDKGDGVLGSQRVKGKILGKKIYRQLTAAEAKKESERRQVNKYLPKLSETERRETYNNWVSFREKYDENPRFEGKQIKGTKRTSLLAYFAQDASRFSLEEILVMLNAARSTQITEKDVVKNKRNIYDPVMT